MRYDTEAKVGLAMVVVIVLVNAALFIGAAYLIMHFIQKFW